MINKSKYLAAKGILVGNINKDSDKQNMDVIMGIECKNNTL